jgi:hypothetical protein
MYSYLYEIVNLDGLYMGGAMLKSWCVPNIAQCVRATCVLPLLHMWLQQVDTLANKTSCYCNAERVESP